MNKAKTYAISFTFEKKALFGIGVLVALCAVVYTYCMGISILHAVEREELTREAQGLQEEVAALERTYLTQKEQLSPEVARDKGFVAVATPTYITRGSLSFNNPR